MLADSPCLLSTEGDVVHQLEKWKASHLHMKSYSPLELTRADWSAGYKDADRALLPPMTPSSLPTVLQQWALQPPQIPVWSYFLWIFFIKVASNTIFHWVYSLRAVQRTEAEDAGCFWYCRAHLRIICFVCLSSLLGNKVFCTFCCVKILNIISRDFSQADQS